MTINFMKFIDEYVGGMAVFLLAAASRLTKRRTPERVKNILVIKFWGIGSVTLSTPLLAYIKKKMPESQLHYLTLETNAELCYLIKEIDSVHTISLRSFAAFLRSLIKAIRQLKREDIHLVYDLEFFTNISAVISVLVGSACRVGFHNSRATSDSRRQLYTVTEQFEDMEHTAKNFLRLADRNAEVYFPGFHIKNIATPLAGSDPFRVAFNINASSLAYERRWDTEGFRQLAGYLIQRFGAHIVLIGSSDERRYVGDFAGALESPNAVTNLCGELSIAQLVVTLESCDLIVTNDSGPLHLASALNIPTMSFFGPETPRRYGSLADLQITFYRGLWCSPCMTVSNLKTVNCINNMQCMKQIRFHEIKESVDKFITSLSILKKESEPKEVFAERL